MGLICPLAPRLSLLFAVGPCICISYLTQYIKSLKLLIYFICLPGCDFHYSITEYPHIHVYVTLNKVDQSMSFSTASRYFQLFFLCIFMHRHLSGDFLTCLITIILNKKVFVFLMIYGCVCTIFFEPLSIILCIISLHYITLHCIT